ncbi:hypothetical protein NQZ68_033937 [Dissostichus eleginoides]|nr:hypothetical protein NQZ68_033937 [Dissostichus eleginoides]
MSEDNPPHYRLDPSDRLNGLGGRRKRPKKGGEEEYGSGGEQELGLVEQVEHVVIVGGGSSLRVGPAPLTLCVSVVVDAVRSQLSGDSIAEQVEEKRRRLREGSSSGSDDAGCLGESEGLDPARGHSAKNHGGTEGVPDKT